MAKGRVKEYDPDRGFGTIIDDDGSKEHIVYANSITLKPGEIFKKGEMVEFRIDGHRHRDWAVNVRIISKD